MKQQVLGALSAFFLLLVAWGFFTYSSGWPVSGGPQNREMVAAASNGDASTMRALLQAGADPNSPHLAGNAPLWWAVSSGSLETVQLLLSRGADPNSRGKWDSVIHEAAGLARDPPNKDAERRAIAQALLDRAAQIKDPAQVKLLKDALAKKPSQ